MLFQCFYIVLAPLHVTNVSASANISPSLDVSWRPPIQGIFDSFIIEAQGEGGNVSVVTETVENMDQTSALLTGLQPGTLYTVTVQSVSFNISSSINNDTSVARNVPTSKLYFLLLNSTHCYYMLTYDN